MSGHLISPTWNLWLRYCAIDPCSIIMFHVLEIISWFNLALSLPHSTECLRNWSFNLPLPKLVLEILIAFAMTLCCNTKFVVLIQASFIPSLVPTAVLIIFCPYDLPNLKYGIEILCFCYHATQQHENYRS